eukprot:5027079-Amphidinium_carterae.1
MAVHPRGEAASGCDSLEAPSVASTTTEASSYLADQEHRGCSQGAKSNIFSEDKQPHHETPPTEWRENIVNTDKMCIVSKETDYYHS